MRGPQVGKRAPQAASHTDTSFKSKRVRVSAQSILHDLGDEHAITARGLGVQVHDDSDALVGCICLFWRVSGIQVKRVEMLARDSQERMCCAS